ncbi:MAG: TonB-dependent receptor plug domain-containing protein [Gemmatimonadota bacterium]
MRPLRFFSVCVALAAWGATPLVAQSDVMSATDPDMGAIFQGQIVDSISGDPIEGVLVRMDTGATTFTNRLGEFTITGLPQGRRLFALLTADCRITWSQITVVNGIPRDERYRLPPAFGAVAAEEEEIVEERKRTGGRVLEQEEIDRISASSVLELVRRIAPNMVSPMQGAPGDISSLVAGRSRSTGAATDAPVVVIDGVRMPGVEGTLHTMRPTEISRLEIQPGAAAGWEYGSSGASGVIKIEMRRGIADGQAERLERAECVVPEFPRG